MRQLADMFNEVAGVDKPQRMQKQFSSSELGKCAYGLY